MANSWLAVVWSHPVGARLAYYPTLLYGILQNNSERRWYDRIDNKVILGALPFHKTAKELVLKENIGGVVTLNEKYETRFLCPSKRQWNEMGVQQLHIPTVDYNNAPSLTQVTDAIKFINSIEDTKSVYIHCKAGRSRSATVALCYMIKIYSMNPNEAIKFVREKRSHIVLGDVHRRRIEDFYVSNS